MHGTALSFSVPKRKVISPYFAGGQNDSGFGRGGADWGGAFDGGLILQAFFGVLGMLTADIAMRPILQMEIPAKHLAYVIRFHVAR